jgi:cysteine desulfurase
VSSENSKNLERIYLDYAATTPLRSEAADAMRMALSKGSYNPSSLHAEGRRSRAVLDDARDRVARLLGVPRKGIVFTGSGSEADNLAILGTARASFRQTGRRHIVTSAIEHHAVLHAVDALAREGFEITIVPVTSDGLIDPERFEAALRDDTALASIMYANNEIGTVQPIAELARRARARGVPFHTDAIQTPLWLPIGVSELGVDLLAISGHKFFGPKGAGVLAISGSVAFEPLVYGGGQEFGRRAGTENVAGIAALAEALERAAAERDSTAARVRALRDRLERELCNRVADVRINGAGTPRLPNVLSVSFAGVDAQALLARLDLGGVAVSAGSACTSGVLEPSHVIAALGIEPRWHEGTIRFSLGPPTTQPQVDRTADIATLAVADVRRPAASA